LQDTIIYNSKRRTCPLRYYLTVILLQFEAENMSFKVLSDCHTSTQDHQSILHWIQTVTPSSPSTWQHPQAGARNNPRKRPRNKELHEKTSGNKASKRRTTLAESSGNTMAPNGDDPKATRRSRRLKDGNAPLSTPQKFKQSTAAGFTPNQNDEDADETPSNPESPNVPSFPSQSPSAPRSSTSEQSVRSRSPVKTMMDLLFSQRQTLFKSLNGQSMTETGNGISEKYPALVKASQGIGVISRSLEVFIPRTSVVTVPN